MSIKITILGDTHIHTFDELPKNMLKEIIVSDWVIHVGDYTYLDVLNGLIKLKGERFIGVYGNADPNDIRKKINSNEIFEISGKRIGITHPVSGGPLEIIENKVLGEFKNENVDAIIFGHTHEPIIQYNENVLLINPGKGYLETEYYGPSTTIVILEIDNEIHGEIKKVLF